MLKHNLVSMEEKIYFDKRIADGASEDDIYNELIIRRNEIIKKEIRTLKRAIREANVKIRKVVSIMLYLKGIDTETKNYFIETNASMQRAVNRYRALYGGEQEQKCETINQTSS